MGNIFPIIRNCLVICALYSLGAALAIGEEPIPVKGSFQNLIPRFKMPPGNLLRYRIPQWEVLYYLKYGIVPFVFYDPNFNRTNFITQVQKFKTYFDIGRPNRTLQPTDDGSSRDYLEEHGIQNYNAFDQNNKPVGEMMDLLAAGSEGDSQLNEKSLAENMERISSTFPPLDVFMGDFDTLPSPVATPVATKKRESWISKKQSNDNEEQDAIERDRVEGILGTFLNKYPQTWRYTNSLSKVLMDHESSRNGRLSYPSGHSSSDLKLHRNGKIFRVGTRNVNLEPGGGGGSDDAPRSGPTEPRKGKNFQTQGW